MSEAPERINTEAPERVVLHRTQYRHCRTEMPKEGDPVPRIWEIYAPYVRADIAEAEKRAAVEEIRLQIEALHEKIKYINQLFYE